MPYPCISCVLLGQLAGRTSFERAPAVLRRCCMRPGRAQEVNSVEAIKSSVEANLGVAFLSTASIEKEVALGRLSPLTITGMPGFLPPASLHSMSAAEGCTSPCMASFPFPGCKLCMYIMFLVVAACLMIVGHVTNRRAPQPAAAVRDGPRALLQQGRARPHPRDVRPQRDPRAAGLLPAGGAGPQALPCLLHVPLRIVRGLLDRPASRQPGEAGCVHMFSLYDRSYRIVCTPSGGWQNLCCDISV